MTKQHKECTCKFSVRSLVFSAVYADFCHCPNSVIITNLSEKSVLVLLNLSINPYFSDSCCLLIIILISFNHCLELHLMATCQLVLYINAIFFFIHFIYLLFCYHLFLIESCSNAGPHRSLPLISLSVHAVSTSEELALATLNK